MSVRFPTESSFWIKSAKGTLVDQDVQLSADENVACIPLTGKKQFGASYLVSTGVAETLEPSGGYVSKQIHLNDIIEILLAKKMPIYLQRAPAEQEFIKKLMHLKLPQALVIKSKVPGVPYIKLGPQWSIPEENLNKGRQSDFRRSQKKAEKLGSVSFEYHKPTAESAKDLLQKAFEIENKSWKGSEGTALLQDKFRLKFFEKYFLACAEDNSLRVAFLKIGDIAVAMQIAVIFENSYWIFKIGHDSAFNTCSPGVLLLRETIRKTQEEGHSTYELLGYDAPWIQIWTTTLREMVEIRVFPVGLNSAFAFTKFIFFKLRRKMKL
jgi:hypothetical protein